jgi:hypothetical protein
MTTEQDQYVRQIAQMAMPKITPANTTPRKFIKLSDPPLLTDGEILPLLSRNIAA